MQDFQSPRQVSRRTIVKGAAWSVPVIAAAAAAPLAAASTTPGTPGFTETHTFLNFNYEASKWCANGQAFRPDSIDGSIADGFVFQYNDANGNPLAGKNITLVIDRQNSGSFWFVTDPFAGDDRGAQLTTITLQTDANGALKLDSSVPGIPVSGSAAFSNWGYLRYGSGSSNANLSLQAWPTDDPSKVIILDISNGSEGKHPHPGNKTRNYDGGQAC